MNLPMSDSTLLRTLKRLTGLSPSEYIREHRLSMARTYLETGKFNSVAEIAFEIGFADPKSFSRSFKSRYGKAPSSYLVRK